MPQRTLNTTIYIIMILCILLLFVNVMISAILSLVICGIQQFRIDEAEYKAKSAQSEAKVYKTFIYKHLCKYKGGLYRVN